MNENRKSNLPLLRANASPSDGSQHLAESGIDFNWSNDHKQWYNEIYLKSEHWRELKGIKLKAKPTCERCGAKKFLQIHHLNYKNIFDVELEDLMTLCNSCHKKEHDENGLPTRGRANFENYFPKQVVEKIEEQQKTVSGNLSTKEHIRNASSVERLYLIINSCNGQLKIEAIMLAQSKSIKIIDEMVLEGKICDGKTAVGFIKKFNNISKSTTGKILHHTEAKAFFASDRPFAKIPLLTKKKAMEMIRNTKSLLELEKLNSFVSSSSDLLAPGVYLNEQILFYIGKRKRRIESNFVW